MYTDTDTTPYCTALCHAIGSVADYRYLQGNSNHTHEDPDKIEEVVAGVVVANVISDEQLFWNCNVISGW